MKYKVLQLVLGFLVSTSTSLAAFKDITYPDLVANPNLARSNPEFRSFISGVGLVIRMDYLCSEQDLSVLMDPDAMIDSLVNFSKTDWGKDIISGTLGIGNMRYPRYSGEAIILIYTQHKSCERHKHARPRSQ